MQPLKHYDMKSILAILMVIGTGSCFGQSIPAADMQIKTAVLAAPKEQRENATVMGYSPKGELVVLRKGSNGMICLADDPGQKGFSVSCYHENLEPFMARGRALKKEGKSFKETD